LLLLLTLIIAGMSTIFLDHQIIGAFMLFSIFFILPGFCIINPNESLVFVLFGDYKGTIKQNVFF
jgi:hypothetical protein